MQRLTAKQFTLNILNGLSTGVVLALIPNALTSSIIKMWLPSFSILNTITGAVACLLPVFAGFVIGHLCGFLPLQSAAVAGAALMGSGIVTATGSGYVFSGTGDVVNIAVTLAVAAGMVLLIGDRFKSYTLLVMPLIVMWVAGLLGMFTLPYVKTITTAVGLVVNHLTSLQPHVMGLVMGVVFACMIVSPISSVGIATAVGLSGIASGSANLGITAGAVTLAAMSWSQNGTGVSLAHFLGTPKIQMANMLEHPRLFVPVATAGGLCGLIGATLGIHGTSMSAGFGFSGLIGPIAALSASSLPVIGLAFVVSPVVIAVVCKWLFCSKLSWIDGGWLKLDFK